MREAIEDQIDVVTEAINSLRSKFITAQRGEQGDKTIPAHVERLAGRAMLYLYELKSALQDPENKSWE